LELLAGGEDSVGSKFRKGIDFIGAVGRLGSLRRKQRELAHIIPTHTPFRTLANVALERPQNALQGPRLG
jgi:hypothetical protein